jgi:hypothetical protein
MTVFTNCARIGKPLLPRRAATQAPRRPQQRTFTVERLEERIVPSALPGELIMTGATALSPQVVSADYQVTGSALTGPMTLAIYRAPSPAFDAAHDVLAGQATLSGVELSVGSQQVTVTLSQPLDIDPAMKYVLAVANPGGQVPESSQSVNVASFRTWIIGAVVHGLEFASFGAFPSWVTALASSLESDGYDAAIPYNWAALSASTAPGVVTAAAQGLAAQINQTIANLPIQPNDVVDIHLIGQSRGADVASLAAGLLDWNAPPLQGGYLKLTLLDPHPARNGPVAYDSVSNGPIGQLVDRAYLAIQADAADPPLRVPPRVNQAEVFYQTATVQDTLAPQDRVLNLWGAVPVGGSPSSISYFNLTQAVPSHLAMVDFYQAMVVPTLATDAPVPIPSSAVPPPPAGGGPACRTVRAGPRYEQTQLREIGVSSSAATGLLTSFARLDRALDKAHFSVARSRFRSLDRQISRLGQHGALGFATATIQQFVQVAESLLLPDST